MRRSTLWRRLAAYPRSTPSSESVRLYEGSIRQFQQDVIHSRIADKLAGAFKAYYHHAAGKSEVGAWQQSFNFLKNSFEVASLGDNRIIINYELTDYCSRLDAMLIGPT